MGMAVAQTVAIIAISYLAVLSRSMKLFPFKSDS